jgi:Lipopolysaccharide kinase (Kdo/WaaP) family
MPPIRVLRAYVDPEDISEFRILVDGRHVKYLTIAHGIYTVEDMCFKPSLIAMLPSLPPGDWNEAHISLNPADGQPHFVKVTKTSLPAITHIWHPRRIDHLDLCFGRNIRLNVYEATCSEFSMPVVVKLAQFPWEIPQLDTETRAYSWIVGQNIGPAFLGHVEEEGRVVGFVMELIADAQHAGIEHLSLCQQALTRLHQLGIEHGDVNKHNFLVRNGMATLIDFENAHLCDDDEVLEEELMSLEEALQDTSGRGGTVTES